MTATLRIALLAALAMHAGPALAARSDWATADRSQVRLLVSGKDGAGLAGGVEILLEPGWHTYWRNPGETGVPPSFDFSDSENVSRIEVFFPAPERYDDGASVSLIYRDEVVFPISVTPKDNSKPVRLQLAASFGVCRDICIPTRAGVELDVPASPVDDPLGHARLAAYNGRIPAPPQPGRFDVEGATLEGDALLIHVRAPDSTYADLFTEAPAGWYLGQPSLVSRADGISRYRLSLHGRPSGTEVRGQSFRFVAIAGSEAIEETIEVR